MRLFDHLKPFAISLSAFLAMTGGAAASETSYYSGKPWEVVLHVSDAQNERPYCAFRTTLWDTRAISIETMIGAGDAVAMALRVRKEAWNLPLNQTTIVAAESVAGMGAEVPMKAISVRELYSDVPAASVPEFNFMFATTLQLMLARREPQPLAIKFSGNEPLWTVPALDRFQAFEINEAFKRCDLDLRGLQSKAEQGDSSQQATSPFGAASPTGQPPAQPSVSSHLPTAPSDWEFYTRDEDWGHTCFAQTHHGIVMVGFMGSPGKDPVGFVSSLFSGDTRATWHVDDKPAYVSDGSESDYFSWHEFGQLPKELLDQMAQGTELAVTGAKGERVAVSLTGAADVLSKFKGCFSKP
ncbi:hypothetical protein ELI47_37955 [Rhizobium ruizarguesonis]|uniref:hypothetical protein n=1 Tax=Rhizobium ruizarguesonis TaxID=2081791 RepID=UPI00102F8C05|nr:hypothetical protein [Rhizobium ruizarguesonis]TAU15513.1 hypothetical protein ELI47_37955 [Rhizobium ruizarguesonis]